MFNSKIACKSVLFLFIFCLIIPVTAASGRDRTDTWDFYIPVSYMESAHLSGQHGSSLDINSDFGFGFGFGYNFTQRFQLGGLFTFGSSSYDARVVQEDDSIARYNQKMDISTISMNGTYFFMEGDFTPFISGSVGSTYVDTNIATGPPSGTCWWDPWWGWVCSSYVPTKTEHNLSYGLGLGIRYDINNTFGFQFSYNKTWFDIGKISGTPDFDTWRLGFIFRY